MVKIQADSFGLQRLRTCLHDYHEMYSPILTQIPPPQPPIQPCQQSTHCICGGTAQKGLQGKWTFVCFSQEKPPSQPWVSHMPHMSAIDTAVDNVDAFLSDCPEQLPFLSLPSSPPPQLHLPVSGTGPPRCSHLPQHVQNGCRWHSTVNHFTAVELFCCRKPHAHQSNPGWDWSGFHTKSKIKWSIVNIPRTGIVI